MESSTKEQNFRLGLTGALACQLIWGFLPIFWQSLKPINCWVIILYRIFTMAVYSLICARFKYTFKQIFEPLKDHAVRRKYFSAGLILTINWSIYIYAINTEHVIQSTIGYYIEPLVVCLFGIVLFKEELNRYNLAAMILALSAVALILIHFHQVPMIALGLALSFSTYSAIKKTARVEPLLAIVYETLLYGPLALIGIIIVESKGLGAIGLASNMQLLGILITGLVTWLPMFLFGIAAKHIPLILVGLLQYISPTITLALGILLFKEAIDFYEIIAFGIIWLGLIIYTLGGIKSIKKNRA